MGFQKCAILAYMTYNKSVPSLLLYGHLISLTALQYTSDGLFTQMDVMKNSDETQLHFSPKQAYPNALLANDIWFLY
jgi:hypothetical protein